MEDTCTAVNARRIMAGLRGIFVRQPEVVQIFETLEHLLEAGEIDGEVACLLLVGVSGVGKSTLLDRFAAAHPRRDESDRTVIPVVVVKVPPHATVKGLAKAILLKLGSEFVRGDEVDLTYQVLTLLRECRVRLLLIDEANHLIDRGAAKTHYHIADWLKMVGDEWGRAMVLAGVPQTAQLLEANEQLQSRFRHRVELRRLIDHGDDLKALRGALKSFQKRLDCVDAIDFSTPETARRFALATDGRFRELRNLLTAAVVIVAKAERPRLDLGVLERAFAQVIYPGAQAETNPFSHRFRGTPLTKPGEPFAPVDHSWRRSRSRS